LRFAKVELAHPLCEFFLRKAAARVFLGIHVSFYPQFQIIPPQNVVQHWLVDLCLLKQLLDPRQIFRPTNARRDGDDVLGPKNFCRTPSYSIFFASSTASSVNPDAARNRTGKSLIMRCSRSTRQ